MDDKIAMDHLNVISHLFKSRESKRNSIITDEMHLLDQNGTLYYSYNDGRLFKKMDDIFLLYDLTEDIFRNNLPLNKIYNDLILFKNTIAPSDEINYDAWADIAHYTDMYQFGIMLLYLLKVSLVYNPPRSSDPRYDAYNRLKKTIGICMSTNPYDRKTADEIIEIMYN